MQTTLRTTTSATFLLTVVAASAAAQTSVKDGHFLDPSVWDSGVVPGPGSVVVIDEDHTVGLYPQGMSAEPVRLASLTVKGTLVSSWPIGTGGESVIVETAYFECPKGGEVLGEDSSSGPGGSVHISSDDSYLPWGNELALVEPAPWTFVSHGLIKGGDGTDGGDVVIDYPGGRFEHCGVIKGGFGTRGGSVRVLATHAENFQIGVIEGGDGDVGGGGSADLIVTTTATSDPALLVNLPGGIVKGGSSPTGRGGDAGMAAYDPFGKGAMLVHEGIEVGPMGPEGPSVLAGGDGTEPGHAWLASPMAEVWGKVLGGEELAGGLPTGSLGEVTVSLGGGTFAKECEVAGGSIEVRVGDFAGFGPFSTTPAFEAGAIDLLAAPSAALDFMLSVPGDFAIGAGGVFVAPEFLMLPGMPLGALMPGVAGPLAPGTFAESWLATSSTITAWADETAPGTFGARFDVHLGHFGNAGASLELVLLAEPSLGLAETVFVPATPFAVADDLRTSLEVVLTPGPVPAPLVELELYSGGGLIDAVELPIALLSRKPSVELFGTGDDLLYFAPPATFTPPLVPVAGSVVAVPSSGSPFILGFLLLDTAFLEPTLPLVGVDLWVSPFASPYIPMFSGATPSLPVTLTGPTFAGLELMTQAVIADPFAAPGATLTETNALKLAFRP